MSSVYVLSHPGARANAVEAVRKAPDGHKVTVAECGRDAFQNDKQWPYLRGFAEQLQWPVNGALVSLTEEEWKDVLTAAFENDTSPRLAAGFDGGVVMLGRRTSKYGKRRFAEWMEFLRSAAALKGVEPVYSSRLEEIA